MRIIIAIILLLASIFSSCQNKQLTRDELSEKFSKDWCGCMEEKSEGKTSEEIISQVVPDCVRGVMSQYVQDKQLYDGIRVLIAAKNYDESLSDYEKERLFGRELGKELVTNAVDECETYRKALIQFKKDYIEKAKQDANTQDKVEVGELINNMQSQLDEIDISQVKDPKKKKQISSYYLLLGLMYEYAEKDALAVKQYDKAIEFDSESSTAIGLKKLLVKYKE
ncbi:tetratricopeptide (TPR) repeat protein [Dysgonomonas sp. PFB1-18]|uniref:hypothetical protein n=1 Tax=unclassified Dysgonomonas TaxID=2630389 RepID=UPI0024755540|nr:MULTISPECIES: hypothetical protein [unclassified Dysgonomonas]MDH6307965.1 tetratricopeptide (TPR) repeat protein [Dysgonomonas sp. PF1-14]MDH6339504.1 tetratricopeptide (TPR) repeat protein [Dysgonomonas sp. PF1-16]MDH6381155.1 tetratricopeptide (TPR) repeat protein [Dysgonomonas sp. PFB1-18]MDH6398367.1 tetratricopeptide (TPR) repeat protein [Dysgonomonas sp. PF1-23]